MPFLFHKSGSITSLSCDPIFKGRSCSIIAQQLADVLVGRTVSIPKFQISSYDKLT